jgi:hypothetical protein
MIQRDISIFNQLILFDTSRSGNESLSCPAHDVAPVLQTAIQFFNGGSINNRKFNFRLPCSPHLLHFMGDPQPEEVIEPIITKGGNLETNPRLSVIARRTLPK